MPSRKKKAERSRNGKAESIGLARGRMKLRIFILLFVLGGGGLAFWGNWRDASPSTQSNSATSVQTVPQTQPARNERRSPNALLVTLDSIRPDHLGCYGANQVPTPAIDALAADGVVMASAFTVTPTTFPAHASILTGLYPIHHGIRDDGPYRLDEAKATLAESLKSAGYATAAFVSAFLLERRYGLLQGFDSYDDTMSGRRRFPGAVDGMPYRQGNLTTDAAIHWLTQHMQKAPTVPFFVWVHLFDGQTPYVSPEPHATVHRQHPYRGAVAFVDEQIGRLTAYLRAQGSLDNTLIVVVGSHGEGLMEHGEETHGYLLYDATIAVPMIWHYPAKLTPPRVSSEQLAATIDIVPTMLFLMGITHSEPTDGLNIFAPPVQPPRVILAEALAPKLRHGWSALVAARGPAAKFIDAPTPEFYESQNDPKETVNLFESDPGQVDKLRMALQEQKTKSWGTSPLEDPKEALVGAETMRLFRERGYLAELPRPSVGLEPDPKDMIGLFDQYQIATSLVGSGRYADAMNLIRQLLMQSPRDAMAWSLLATASGSSAQIDEAIACSLRAAALQPRERHWITLARYFWQKGDTAASDLALDQMREMEPADGELFLLMGQRALAEGRLEKAAEYLDKARAVDPSRQSANSFAWTGDLLLTKNDELGARQAYQAALGFDPNHVVALEGLAGIEQRAGRVDAEAEYLRRLGRARPSTIVYANRLSRLYASLDRREDAVAVMKDYLSRNRNEVAAIGNLGNAYVETGQLHEAIAEYQKAIQIAPDYAMARFNLAGALDQIGDVEGAIEQYRKVIELRPDHAPCSKRLMTILVSNDRLDEAFAELERAAARNLVEWEDLLRFEPLGAIVGDPRFQEIRNRYAKE